MNDLVYRQAVIDTVQTMYERCDTYDITDYRDMMRESLIVLPPAPEQQWIPVSEDMPKGQELVNVSCHDTSGDTSFDYTSSGWATTDGEYWIVDNEINNYVVAWMPLPKPYKEGK